MTPCRFCIRSLELISRVWHATLESVIAKRVIQTMLLAYLRALYRAERMQKHERFIPETMASAEGALVPNMIISSMLY